MKQFLTLREEFESTYGSDNYKEEVYILWLERSLRVSQYYLHKAGLWYDYKNNEGIEGLK